MKTLWMDLETFSATPITDGTYKYAANAEIMLLTWALDAGPVHCWELTKGETMHFELSDALTDEKGDAPTYIDMVRHNIRTLSAALTS